MTDDVWINDYTREQRGIYGSVTNETETQLGTAKHAGVNIVLFRESGARRDNYARLDWVKNRTKLISNT
ncbi:hypothetical protein AAVH_22655, partial [Aphelenchoides avenae]